MTVDHVNDPIFKQLVGKKLRKVIKELGFPGVPSNVFDPEDILIFQQYMEKLPTSHPAAGKQLSRSLHKGNVTAIHSTADGKTCLNVRFNHLGYHCTVQLRHWRENWETAGTAEVRPAKSHVTIPLVATAVVIVLVGVGMIWGLDLVNGTRAASVSTVDEAIALVEKEDYIVLTPEQKNKMIRQAEEQGYQVASEELEREQAEIKEGVVSGQKEKKVLIFPMREGMTSKDLTDALNEHGFIDDSSAFSKRLESSGVATKVHVGNYTFTSDMTEDEIIQALQ